MRLSAPRWLAGCVVAGLLASLPGHARAAGDAGGPDAERRARVVARVGERAITVADLEDRMAQLAPAQRTFLGATPDAAKRKLLEDVLVREALLEHGAETRGVARAPHTAYDLDRTRADAVLRAIRTEVGTAASSKEDVQKYYDAHRDLYDAPERYNVWRILCASREEAITVLAAAKKDPTVQNFTALAREHSVDKATNLRGGNLGFVALDGQSSEAGLRVEPGIVKAASTVRDGEFVPDPVAEGPHWAVVWRRGTVGASKRSLADVEPQIRDTIVRERVDAKLKERVAALKKEKVSGYEPDLLKTLELRAADGVILPRKRAGQVAPYGAPSPPSSR
jgi:peptidyl-prolyl cis-trans isomerase C